MERVLRIWKEYYNGLMNEENEREGRDNDGERVNLEVERIGKEEVGVFIHYCDHVANTYLS